MVAKMIVHDVFDRYIDSGSMPASAREPVPAASAMPSHNSTESGVIGPVAVGTEAMMSPLAFAFVQRLKAGAALASENSTATHTE